VAWLQTPEGKEAIENFSGAIREIGNFIRDAAKAFMDNYGVIEGFVGLINGLSFEELKTKLLELPGFWGMVFRAASDTATGVWNAVNNMILGVRHFALDVQKNILLAVNWFQQLPGRVGAAMSSAGSWLYNAGRQVIEGFVGGITSMVGRIQRAITDTVGGAITWAKDLLGIQSPSKVFEEIGEYTSLGYARGIEREYGMVRSASSGMVAAAVPDFSNGFMSGTLALAGDGLSAYVDGRMSYSNAERDRIDNAGRRKVH
jgi:hypothetical protein